MALFIFDLDGVLTNPCKNHEVAISQCWVNAYRQLTRTKQSDLEIDELLQWHYKTYGMSCFGHGENIDTNDFYYLGSDLILQEKLFEGLEPIDGLYSALLDLKRQGHRFAIYSMAHTDCIFATLKHLNLHELFDPEDVFGLNKLGVSLEYRGKGIKGFQTIMRRYPSDYVIFFEDSYPNLNAARNFGISVALVNSQNPLTYAPSNQSNLEGLHFDFNEGGIISTLKAVREYLQTT